MIEKSSLELYAPEELKHELLDKKSEILTRSRKTGEQYDYLVDRMLKLINIVNYKIVDRCIPAATQLIGQQDLKDVIYVATALCTDAVAIWSHDSDFTLSNFKVYSTADILKHFNIIL